MALWPLLCCTVRAVKNKQKNKRRRLKTPL